MCVRVCVCVNKSLKYIYLNYFYVHHILQLFKSSIKYADK